jgi:hypothetical protein
MQLRELSLEEVVYASPQSREDVVKAIEDDAWVFGRLRRLGCIVDARFNPTVASG